MVGGGLGALSLLGYHYQAYHRPRRATRRERRRRRAGMSLLQARERSQRDALRKIAEESLVGGARRRRRRRRRPRKAVDPGAHRQGAASSGSWRLPTCSRSSASTPSSRRPAPTTWGAARSTKTRPRSFSVDPAEKLYYCFGCGEGGDLLVVHREEGQPRLRRSGRGARRPLRRAARVRRVQQPRRRRPAPARAPAPASRAHARLLRAGVVGSAGGARRPRATSPSVASARRSAGSSASGYSLPAWSRLRDAAGKKGFSEHELTDAGLVVPGQRAASTTASAAGSCSPRRRARSGAGLRRAHAGRRQTEIPELPETLLYHKSEALFGLDKARTSAAKLDRCSWSKGTPTSSRWCRPA